MAPIPVTPATRFISMASNKLGGRVIARIYCNYSEYEYMGTFYFFKSGVVYARRAHVERPHYCSLRACSFPLPKGDPIGIQLRASNYIMVLQSLLVPPLKGWSGSIPYCARRTSTF
jgi:hypothetical protein